MNIFAQTDTSALIDETSWNELVSTVDGDAGLIREIVAEFLTSAGTQFRDLAGSIARQDADTARRLAHTIKGGAATIGAAHVATAAADIEHAARAGIVSGLEPKLQVLDSSISLARRTLNARIQALA